MELVEAMRDKSEPLSGTSGFSGSQTVENVKTDRVMSYCWLNILET
jgi:hypothetical protein